MFYAWFRVVELNITLVFSATFAGGSPFAADKQGSGSAVCGWQRRGRGLLIIIVQPETVEPANTFNQRSLQ